MVLQNIWANGWTSLANVQEQIDGREFVANAGWGLGRGLRFMAGDIGMAFESGCDLIDKSERRR